MKPGESRTYKIPFIPLELTIKDFSDATLVEKISKTDRFPGTLEEFNHSKGVEHEPMDVPYDPLRLLPPFFCPTGKIIDSYDLGEYVKEGCVGLVEYTPRRFLIIPAFGIPVKRKL